MTAKSWIARNDGWMRIDDQGGIVRARFSRKRGLEIQTQSGNQGWVEMGPSGQSLIDYVTQRTLTSSEILEAKHAQALERVRVERDEARRQIADAPHATGCRVSIAGGMVSARCTCWKAVPYTPLTTPTRNTDEPEKKMSDYWVAIVSDTDRGDSAQVCDAPESALFWLAEQISQSEWEGFYDALDDADKASMKRDRLRMDPKDVLTAWVGDPEDELTWGSDLITYKVERQTLFTTRH